VEAGVGHRQGGRRRLVEGDVVVPLAAAHREAEHLRAAVDADHRALWTDPVEQLGDVEPGPAADVEDMLPRDGCEGVVDEPPAALEVAPRVHRLDPARERLVEDELAHRAARSPAGRGRSTSAW